MLLGVNSLNLNCILELTLWNIRKSVWLSSSRNKVTTGTVSTNKPIYSSLQGLYLSVYDTSMPSVLPRLQYSCKRLPFPTGYNRLNGLLMWDLSCLYYVMTHQIFWATRCMVIHVSHVGKYDTLYPSNTVIWLVRIDEVWYNVFYTCGFLTSTEANSG